MKRYRNLKRGDVIYADLGEHPKCAVQSGNRPCIVISNEKSNRYSSIYNVLPCTGKIKENPVHVRILPQNVHGYFEKESDILPEQITTIDERQIVSKVGHLPEDSKVFHQINKALIKQLSLGEEIRRLAQELIKTEQPCEQE